MARRVAVALLAILGAAGCATIPEDECAKTDWYELGVKDGRAGHPSERVAQHREACARVKIEPDELRYLQGRKVGIAEYCQPDNAFRDGLSGHEYQGVCDATFARNHRAAYNVATIRKEIETNRSAISWREAEIRSDRTSDSRRSNLRSEVRELDRTRDALRDRLVVAERELDRMRATALVAPVAVAPAAKPAAPPPPPRPMVPVGSPGAAMGKLQIGTTDAPLHFAYAFVAPDPLDQLKPRPMLLLSPDAIPANILGEAADLDRVLRTLPYYVLAMRNDAKPPKLTLIVWHPGLGQQAAVEQDAGKSGVARFDVYGSARIAGALASPQSGKNPYGWNRLVRMNVKFDAPFVRRWPP